eukprot:TRINITY_DN10632_c0_g1_i1.p3 TRINITY_DN10632_c0_g1~~TRINITY_DN10632_c0_g1_i1.p3  ORF type:complete len:102 (+),score=32.72 TRINITY_DN10632_c0_g1_i1:344-649(+)
MATPEHTPQGKGYQEWYGYYSHANQYWTKGMTIQSTGELDTCLNHFTDLSQANRTYRGGVTDPVALDSSCSSLSTADPPCCLLYTSPSPRDRTRSRMPSSA